MMPKEFIDSGKYRAIQVLTNVFFIAVWYLANDGLAFWDDYTYVSFANQISQGTFEINTNHFTSRVGLLYPVSWLIDIFGVNQYTITIFPLLCGLILLNLLFWIGHMHGHWIGIISGVLLIADYHTITFVTHLFPEIPIALGIFVALLCYDFVNRREGDYRILALILAISLFGAFLIKTSILILFPLFAYLVINDMRRKNNRGFWRISISLLVFFFLLHGFWYMEAFGDFFYRFNNISDNHEATVKTFFDKDGVDILKRLTYLPFLGFLRGGFFIPLGFALPALLTLKKNDWRLNKPEMLWPVASVLMIASWWFISTNWKYYSPMPVDTRHITFVIPVLIMAGAYYWSDKVVFAKVMGAKLKWLPLAALLAIPAYKIYTAEDKNYTELKGLITTEFVNNNNAQTIITDGLVAYGSPYFYNFESSNDTYQWWVELDFSKIRIGDYLLVNEATLNDRYEEPGYLSLLRNSITAKGWQLETIYQGNVVLQIIRE